MKTHYTKAEQIEAAESALFRWACGNPFYAEKSSED